MADRTRVLIPINEPIGGSMSAVGIRQFEIGKALAPHCDVTFASGAATNDTSHGISIVPCRNRREFRALVASHDVLYTLGLNSDRFLDVVRSGIRSVFDIYTPLAFEILEMWPEVPTRVLATFHRRTVRWTLAQLAQIDLIVCTNEQQRDMWLGAINATGILDASRARLDPDARKLACVVPFGLPDASPQRNGQPIRTRFPAFDPDDFILLWSSKILAWQDPLTLLRAMHLLRDERPRFRLVFLGIGTPSPRSTRSLFSTWELRTQQAFDLASELGLPGEHVFFVEDRIPYRDMGAWYLDADAGVSTYPASLETHFCLGSRLLDFVWAGLPMVVSGDELQKSFVETHGLGYVTPPGDPHALAEAIRTIRKDGGRMRADPGAFESARDRLRWSSVTKPIIEYCISDEARTRRGDRKRLVATLDMAEFLARSIACRWARWGLR